MEQDWSEHAVRVAGLNLHVMRGGNGRKLLVLHHDIGTLDRLPFYDRLAEQFDRAAAASSRLGPLGTAHLDAQRARPGGDASMAAGRAGRDGLRAAGVWGSAAGSPPRWPACRRDSSAGWCWSARTGIKPPQGDILDQAIVSYIAYPQAGFHDQEAFHRVYGDVSTDQLEAMGHRPRDVLPRRVEAIHVQPDAAASAGRRAIAGAGGVGR